MCHNVINTKPRISPWDRVDDPNQIARRSVPANPQSLYLIHNGLLLRVQCSWRVNVEHLLYRTTWLNRKRLVITILPTDFLQRDAMHSADNAVARCPSVTRRYFVET